MGNVISKWAFTADIAANAIVKADQVNFMILELLEGNLLKSVVVVGNKNAIEERPGKGKQDCI